jgi:hypothetical protein
MTNINKGWNKLFLFCAGLFLGTAFCMKWMESDFVQGGKTFTIIGLEISYPKEKVMEILSGLDERVRTILRYHLSFDFVFMAGVYPGIAALCMMGSKKVSSGWLKKLLIAMAVLQLVAWGCDIYENCCLLSWIKDPVIGDNFGMYHIIVATKWVLALLGAVLGIGMVFKRRI